MDKAGLSCSSLADVARRTLEEHSHFRGRVDHFSLDEAAGVLVVAGSVPTFYLKQLLQTVLQSIDGVKRVVNRVDVVCGHGLSSCSAATRERCALEYAWLGKRPKCFPTCQWALGDPEERESQLPQEYAK